MSLTTDLLKILEDRINLTPNKVAFTFLDTDLNEANQLTYKELSDKAKSLAVCLTEKNLEGERAILLFPPGIEFIPVFFACLYAGVIAVPAYPPRKNRSLDRLESIFKDSNAKVVLTDRKTQDTIESRFKANPILAKPEIISSDEIDISLAANWKARAVKEDDIAFLQYTSGSTGSPKGVMVSHGNLFHNAHDIELGFSHKGPILSWLPVFHDFGLMYGVVQPIFSGIPCYMMAPVSFLQRPLSWLQAITKYKATHSSGPNFAFQLCVDKVKDQELESLDLSHWQMAVSGAEPIRSTTLDAFASKFEPCGFNKKAFCPAYGLAESTLKVSAVPLDSPQTYLDVSAKALGQHSVRLPEDDDQDLVRLVGCGGSEIGAQIEVINPANNAVCSGNEVGEIWVKSNSVAKGYWQKPEETQATFNAFTSDGQGPFLRTGDLGFVHNNELYITGRHKDLIIVRGLNHYPQDIELSAFNSHEALVPEKAAAFSIEENGHEKLVLVQEVKRTAVRNFYFEEATEAIRKDVAKHHNLRVDYISFIKPASLPRTSSGKVQRKLCAKMFQNGALKTIAEWSNKEVYHQPDTPSTQTKEPLHHNLHEVQQWIKELISSASKIPVEELGLNEPFDTYGLDSLDSVTLAEDLSKKVEKPLPPTIAYDYPTIAELSKMLVGLSENVQKNEQVSLQNGKEPIAIIGMSCRFPGAPNPDAYWELLKNGKSAISDKALERWKDQASLWQGESDQTRETIKWAGLLDAVDQFDPQFFGISSKEAAYIDPQQRLLLEVGWEALEHAGIDTNTLSGKEVGVYVGISSNDYNRAQAGYSSPREVYSGTGNAMSIAANRISYALNLQGPSLAVDTACSSSLVALHQAIRAIQYGDCGMALVGGVNLLLSPDLSLIFAKAGMLAPDGRCKTFDEKANGYVRGEGCGMVVLKPLAAAQRDGDNILAIVKGSAITQDGRSHGLTAPNGPSQEKVIHKALQEANIKPKAINYLEAHGTGTSLGDPIEVNTFSRLLTKNRPKDQPLWIGSAKTNIGHLEAAAGMAGLIKTILILKNKTVPAHLHFNKLNPGISLGDLPIKINTERETWNSRTQKFLAAVSSFGFGGTNAHIVLEEGFEASHEKEGPKRPLHILTLSAKTEKALHQQAHNYLAFLETSPESSVQDLCFSANTGRTHFKNRLAFVAPNRASLIEQLKAVLENKKSQHVFAGKVQGHQAPKVAFLFTGQGSQYEGLGKKLYQTHPVFREAMDHCEQLFHELTQKSLLPVLFEEPDTIHKTAYTQPAIFVFEYALYCLWKHWGITPDVVAGHSLGEYAAAVAAGVFSLKDGMKLIIQRGRLMQELPEIGEMYSLFASKDTISPYLEGLEDLVSIAGINSPEATVISGDAKALAKIIAQMEQKGIHSKQLTVSHAFHSPLMKEMKDDFAKVARSIQYHTPTITFVSNLTGKAIGKKIATPSYWVDHILKPVNFLGGMQSLEKEACKVYLEIGPKPILTASGQRCLPESEALWLASGNPKTGDWQQLLSSLAQLYLTGYPVNWAAFERPYHPHKLALPSYPFQRKRYWFNQIDGNEYQAPEPVSSTPAKPLPSSPSPSPIKKEVLPELVAIIAELLHEDAESVDVDIPLLEMGADSLVVMAAIKRIQKSFGVKLSIGQIFGQQANLRSLAEYIEASLPEIPEEALAIEIPQPEAQAVAQVSQGESELEKVIRQQLAVMAQQLEALKGQRGKSMPSHTSKKAEVLVPVSKPMSPFPTREKTPGKDNMSAKQKAHLEHLIQSFTTKTGKSKTYIEQYRPVLSDNRASAGFRFSTKEMLYPIVGERSQGSKLWDLDGNEYVDLAMGFGVTLFGHNPDFTQKAVADQLAKGLHLGPLSDMTGQVASLVTELTHTERVAFCNTGTEAVMTALRMARAVTGRKKIVIFSGSYHGHFDGTLGMAEASNTTEPAVPMTAGILQNMVEDLVVLEFNNIDALQVIEEIKDDLAGILVEPVQSRKPHVQPTEFLHALRKVADQYDAPLIFDEMITGFRIAAGGAQEHFGVEADLVTYGKILGGGLPIGAVAGKSRYLDAIDGGVWKYGDQSFPQTETTFFAGTFCKHPMTMATSHAVLSAIKAQKDSLYPALNGKTSEFTHKVNTFFREQQVPMEVANFGSLFYFLIQGNMDLFFYHLILKGVYMWEGKTCFFSASHDDQDIDFVFNAIKESIADLQAGGFLKRPPTNTLPLSEAQQQLWLLDKINPEASQAYMLSTTLELKGDYQHKHMQQALDMLIQRHEALRTVIGTEGKTHMVLPHYAYHISRTQSGKENGISLEAILNNWRSEAITAPFEICKQPAWDLKILRVTEGRHLLLFRIHHIIADGWTMDVLLSELSELYSSLVASEAPSLLPAKQFRHFLEEQDTWFLTEDYKQQEQFWKEQLTNPASPIRLPLEYAKAQDAGFKGDSYSRTLDMKVSEGVSEISKKTACTPFMTLLTAFSVLMNRLSGQENMIIGVPVSGRTFAEVDNLAGYCAYLLPLSFTVDVTQTFDEYAQACKGLILKAFENQDYPFAHILKNIHTQRGTDGSPLVNVVFNMDPGVAAPNIKGLEAHVAESLVPHTPFDLSFHVQQVDGRIVISCDYKTGLFKEEAIKRLVGYFEMLLLSMYKEAKQPISQLNILPEEERNNVLKTFNNTQADYPVTATIPDLFEAQAVRVPDNIATVFEGKATTYAELNKQANTIAHGLRSQVEIQPGTLIAVMLERSEWMLPTLLGILKSGAGYLPIDPEYPEERIRFMLGDSGASLLISEEKHIDKAPNSVLPVVDVRKISHPDQSNPTRITAPSDLAYVIYTSGSTGTPKGVMVAHTSVVNLLFWMKNELPLSQEDTFILKTPYTFDVSIWELFIGSVVGSTLCILSPGDEKNPEAIAKVITNNQVTAVQFVPSMLSIFTDYMLGERNQYDLSSLHSVYSSGEAISHKQIEDFYAAFSNMPKLRLLNKYGPTEATVHVTSYDCKDCAEYPNVPIGKPVSNVQFHILTAGGSLQPIGVTGELYIAGKCLAKGYLNRPELTKERFIPNPFTPGELMYKTGDLARWLSDGNIEYLGRNDHQIKIRGYRVELGEIEALINRYPSVDACVVDTKPDQYGEPKLLAYVILKDIESTTARQIQDYLKEKLPAYMVPLIHILDAFPLLPNGKVDRSKLKVKESTGTIEQATDAGPASSIEQVIARIWKEELELTTLSIHDNFFDLGGYSRLMIKIFERIQKDIETQLELVDMFQYPTISALAGFIESKKEHQVVLTTPSGDNLIHNNINHLQKTKKQQSRRKNRWSLQEKPK